MSKLEKIKSGEVKITCPVEEKEWKDALSKAFKKISKKVEIKGFRKGQAPENMVRKMVSNQQIQLEACEEIAQGLLVKAVEENNVELIDRPSMDIESISDDECVLTFTCPVKPDVELGEYKGLGYAPKKATVKASEVDDEIKKLLESKAELELKEEGLVEKGDTAVIDFEGFKDGVAFDGGKGENYDLEIGSGSFIPGFEDQLIGMKSEENKEIEVTFPENYQASDLAGKKATFKVTVHEIKKKVLPELTDEFVADLKIENVKNADELKDYIKKNLKDNKQKQLDNDAVEELLTKLADGSKVEIPEVMIKEETENMFNDYANRMQAQGIDMNTYFKITNSSKEAFAEMIKPEASKKVKISLVLGAIAKNENLEVSNEEIEKEYADIASQYNMKVEEVKQYIANSSLKADLLLKKALDFVKNN